MNLCTVIHYKCEIKIVKLHWLRVGQSDQKIGPNPNQGCTLHWMDLSLHRHTPHTNTFISYISRSWEVQDHIQMDLVPGESPFLVCKPSYHVPVSLHGGEKTYLFSFFKWEQCSFHLLSCFTMTFLMNLECLSCRTAIILNIFCHEQVKFKYIWQEYYGWWCVLPIAWHQEADNWSLIHFGDTKFDPFGSSSVWTWSLSGKSRSQSRSNLSL